MARGVGTREAAEAFLTPVLITQLSARLTFRSARGGGTPWAACAGTGDCRVRRFRRRRRGGRRRMAMALRRIGGRGRCFCRSANRGIRVEFAR
jgi:hypothetical protein